MRNRRDTIALVALLVSLIAIALLVRPRAAEIADDDPRHSTYLLGPNGARALFLLMAELGLPAERHLRPWTGELPGGALVVLAPRETPTPREIETTVDWISAGGTLIFGAPPGNSSLADALGLQVVTLRPSELSAFETVRWGGVPAYPERHQWTADMGVLDGVRRGFDVASPAIADGIAEVLLRTQTGEPVAISMRIGDGRIVAFSDPAVLANEALRDGDAALLFVRAVTNVLAPGDTVHFDEYHQGYRAGGGPVQALRHFVATSPWGRALAQAAVAGLLLLLYAGARLGSPVPETGGRRRSPLEHVDALATAYRRAGARRTARRLMLAGLDRRLGRRNVAAALTQASPGVEITPASQRLILELNAGERDDMVPLARAIDDYVSEVRRWK